MSPKIQRFLKVSFLVIVGYGLMLGAVMVMLAVLVVDEPVEEGVQEITVLFSCAILALAAWLFFELGRGLPGGSLHLPQGTPLKLLYKAVDGEGKEAKIFLVLEEIESGRRIVYAGLPSLFSSTAFPGDGPFILTWQSEMYFVRGVSSPYRDSVVSAT